MRRLSVPGDLPAGETTPLYRLPARGALAATKLLLHMSGTEPPPPAKEPAIIRLDRLVMQVDGLAEKMRDLEGAVKRLERPASDYQNRDQFARAVAGFADVLTGHRHLPDGTAVISLKAATEIVLQQNNPTGTTEDNDG